MGMMKYSSREMETVKKEINGNSIPEECNRRNEKFIKWA